MRSDSELAEKEFITVDDLADKPLIISRQALNKKEISKWFNDKTDKLNIVATYNLAYNASLMAEENLGYVLTLDKLINTADSNLKFIPLYPDTTIDIKLVWKKYQIHSKAVDRFIRKIEKIK